MDMLLGTNCLPAMLTIGSEQVQLGTVVARAHRDSGLTVDQWNNQSAEESDVLIVRAFYAMRREAGVLDR